MANLVMAIFQRRGTGALFSAPHLLLSALVVLRIVSPRKFSEQIFRLYREMKDKLRSRLSGCWPWRASTGAKSTGSGVKKRPMAQPSPPTTK